MNACSLAVWTGSQVLLVAYASDSLPELPGVLGRWQGNGPHQPAATYA